MAKKKPNPQVLAIFRRFKDLHPNNQEAYVESLDNAIRWRYHIAQREGIVPYPIIKHNHDEHARMTAELQRYEDLSQMPVYMQDRFLLLSSLFPGRMVYATGSRVNGGYIEEWSGEEVREMREKLGKAKKKKSDYDIVLDMQPNDRLEQLRAALPSWADLLPHGVPPNERIPIGMWDFSKLPKEEHQNAINLYNTQKWGKLMDMHNRYKLSNREQCCNDGPTKRWFRHAIEKGLIQPDPPPTPPPKAKRRKKT